LDGRRKNREGPGETSQEDRYLYLPALREQQGQILISPRIMKTFDNACFFELMMRNKGYRGWQKQGK